MYYCRDCGCIFDDHEAKIVEERHGFDFGPAEIWKYCPNCNSDDFTEAKQCEHCGEWFAEEDLLGSVFCEGCFNEMLEDKDWVAEQIFKGLLFKPQK